MTIRCKEYWALFGSIVAAFLIIAPQTNVQQTGKKPNILFIVSDDTGYGDLGPYGGGEGRGMPTPNIDRIAKECMMFFSFSRRLTIQALAMLNSTEAPVEDGK